MTRDMMQANFFIQLIFFVFLVLSDGRCMLINRFDHFFLALMFHDKNYKKKVIEDILITVLNHMDRSLIIKRMRSMFLIISIM